MKAVVAKGKGGPEVFSLQEDRPKPTLKEHDLLVQLKSIAVNPVDGKDRAANMTNREERVQGWDGVGIVQELGEKATGFKVGDEVMFAGDITRDGTYAEFCAVDSRIVGKKPTSLDGPSSASLPLVFLTAWELLFENLRLPTDGSGKDLVFLMLNGAGGVGSAAIQLAKHVLGSEKVIATASRPETEAWCKSLGADFVINHHNDFEEELKKIGVDKVDVLFCGIDLEKQFDNICKIMRPGGAIGSITIGDASKIDVSKLFFPMRLTLSFELMFARPMLGVAPEKQGKILNQVADLVDAGKIKNICNKTLKGLSVETIVEAQKLQDSGKAIGKIAIEF